MNREVLFGVSALVINLIGFVPYFKGIFAGEVKPQRITWGIWTLLTTIAFVNQVINGGGWSTLFFGSTVVLVSLVFLLSFKYGIGGSGRLDRIVLAATALLFVVWILTGDTITSTYIAIAIDVLGALPTVIKAYKQPETEAYLQWIMAAVAGVLSVVAVGSGESFVLYAYPIYIAVFNAIIVLSKWLGEHKTQPVTK
jgi:hypothetical protein